MSEKIDSVTLTKQQSPPPPHTQRMGILRVSHELLADWLGLPPGTRIDAIINEAYFATDQVGIRIEHASLKETTEGCVLPEIRPSFEAGAVSTRTDWDANGVLRGEPPTVRPDADKLAALLDRIDNHLDRIICTEAAMRDDALTTATLRLRGEIVQAIGELRGQPLDKRNTPKATLVEVVVGDEQVAAMNAAFREKIRLGVKSAIDAMINKIKEGIIKADIVANSMFNKLEAVGLDVDGAIKPIGKLSITPTSDAEIEMSMANRLSECGVLAWLVDRCKALPRPNDKQSWGQLFAAWELDLAMTGNAFLWDHQGSGFSPEVHLIPAVSVCTLPHPGRNSYMVKIDSGMVTTRKGMVAIPAEEVMHVRLLAGGKVEQVQPVRGMSPIAAARVSIDLNAEIADADAPVLVEAAEDERKINFREWF